MPFWIWLILGFVVLSFLGMFAATWPIAKKVYHNILVRTGPEKWTRANSYPPNPEHTRMFDLGMDWARENEAHKRPVSIENEGLKLAGEYFDFGHKRCAIIFPGRTESLYYSYYFAQPYAEAGCNILYGFDSYKVHSKVCLITRKDRSGVQYITQIGTGNYNEKTAKQYTDLSYITSRKEIGQDAAEFFKNMAIRNLEGEHHHLLVAPHAMKDRLLKLIDREIEKGDKGRIFLKVNSVTELELIDRLRDASCAGVRVEMIVRGICCLLPHVETETDNVKITSIVGRYLEHSRIYLFGEGADEVMYISSADFMTRNMDRRVEVGCPIVDPAIRARIHRLIDVQRADNTKARLMRSDGTYQPVVNRREPVDSQQTLMDDAIRNAIREKPAPTLASRLKSIFSRKR